MFGDTGISLRALLQNDDQIPQLKDLIKEPSDFAGMAVDQSRSIARKIKSVTDGKISKVELSKLR